MIEEAGEASAEGSEPNQERGVERLAFFSDAVMAIAMTLLAIDLPIPDTSASNAAAWHELRSPEFRGDYFSLVVSFMVIGLFWMSHHRFFNRVERVNPRFTQINLLFLFGIVVLPYVTRLNGHSQNADQPGVVLYAAGVSFVALTLAICIRYAHRAGLLTSGPDKWRPIDAEYGLTAATIGFLVSIPVAFTSVRAAQTLWWAIPLGMLLLRRGYERFRHGR